MRAHYRAALDELARRGLKGAIVKRGRHPRVVFQLHGRQIEMVCSGTPRDMDATAKNVVANLRKLMGLDRQGRPRMEHH